MRKKVAIFILYLLITISLVSCGGVKKLCEKLEEGNKDEVRLDAATKLGGKGKDKHVIDAIKCLSVAVENDPSVDVRSQSVTSIGEIITKLDFENPANQDEVVRVIPVLVDALGDEDKVISETKDTLVEAMKRGDLREDVFDELFTAWESDGKESIVAVIELFGAVLVDSSITVTPEIEEKIIGQMIVSFTSDQESSVQKAAVIQLGELGKKALRTVPLLSNALKNQTHSDTVLVEVISSLGKLLAVMESEQRVEQAQTIFPLFVEKIGENSSFTEKVKQAITISTKEAQTASLAVDLLLPLLKEKNEDRQLAGIDVLLVFLNEKEEYVEDSQRDKIIEAFVELAKGKTDTPVRQASISAMRDLGKKAKSAIPELINILKDSSYQEEYLIEVADTLVAIDPNDPDLVVSFIQMLKDYQYPPKLRARIARGLGKVSDTEQLPDVCTALIDALVYHEDIRKEAISSLVSLGIEAVDLLISELGNEDIRDTVINILEQIGIEAVSDLADALYEQTDDEEKTKLIREGAAEALREILDPEKEGVADLFLDTTLIESLIRAVALEDVLETLKALLVLEGFKNDAIPILIVNLNDKDLGSYAEDLLKNQVKQDAIPFLLRAIANADYYNDDDLKEKYSTLLESIITSSLDESVPVLLRSLADEDIAVSSQARIVILELDSKVIETINNTLTKEESEDDVQILAAEALGVIGTEMDSGVRDKAQEYLISALGTVTEYDILYACITEIETIFSYEDWSNRKKEAATSLADLLDNNDSDIVDHAFTVLKAITDDGCPDCGMDSAEWKKWITNLPIIDG